MKITSSTVSSYSDHFFNQLDLELSRKTEEKSLRVIRNSRDPSPGNDPVILIDRISIQENSRSDFLYNYSGSLKADSTVTSVESGKIEKNGTEQVLETIVGKVIDKSVVIQNIKEKKDVPFTEKSSTGSENSGSGKINFKNLTESTVSWKMELKNTDIHFEEENIQFNSIGQVAADDGRIIDFSLDLNMSRTFLSRTEERMLIERWKENINLTDPLVISLDGSVPRLSDTRFEFDIDSDGDLENLKFTSTGTGFLAFDKNGDNAINNGSELFGPGTGNGFAELASLDEDGNLWIDENDSVFEKLSVWTKDENGNDRLISLRDAGIGAISLENSSTLFNMTDSENALEGQLKSSGVFLFEDGRAGSIHQIDLAEMKNPPLNTEEPSSPEEIPAGVSSLNSGEISLAPETSGPDLVQQTQESANPLQELLERVEKLKQEMAALLEKMNPVSDQNTLNRRGRKTYFNPELKYYSLMDMYKPGRESRSVHL